MASEENGTVEDDERTEPNEQDERAQVILTCDEKGLLPDPLEDIQSSEIITSSFECSSGIDNHTKVVQDNGDNVLSVSITSTTATTCTVPPSISAPESSESTTLRSTPSLTDANALLSTEIMDKSDEAMDAPMGEQSPIVINVKKLPKLEPQLTKDTSVTVSAVRECVNFVLDPNSPLVANTGSASAISSLTSNVGTTASVAPTNVLPVLSAGTNPIGTFILLTTSPTISNSVPTISVQQVPSPVQAPLPQPISSQQPSASAKPPVTESTEKTSSPTPSTGTNSSASTQSDRAQCLSCGKEGKKSDFVRNGRFCNHDCAYNQSSLLRAFKNPIQMKPSNSKKKIMIKGNKLCVQTMNTPSSHSRSVLPARNGDQSMRPKPLDALDLFDANDEVDDIDQWSDAPKCVPFNWRNYLTRTKSFCAPARCFKGFQVSSRSNNFAAGMKLEGVDPHHPSLFCVLTVAEILGARIRLHFDGYPEMYDFWVNCDSPFIFPVGFCRRTGRKLEPPKDYPVNFNWQSYLQKTESRPAPSKLFSCERQSHSNPPFETGMKLEAVDKSTVEAATGQALVCVATIADILDNWLLIHFDGWDDSYDYWTTINSPYIHPVGWCREKSKQLTPPKDHVKGGRFKWEEYLKETNSLAAPVKSFRLRPPNQFRHGMKLEVVDRYSPRFIRVATVTDRRPYSILVLFDGFESKYDFWCDDDSPDIHPVNWAVKNNHPLQPPAPYLKESFGNIRCPTVSCFGQGNLRNPGLPSTHFHPNDCPYSNENKDKDIPDRLGRHEHDEIDWVEIATNCMDTSSPDTSYPDTSNRRKRRREPSESSDSSSEIVKKSHSSSPSLLMQNHRSKNNSNNSSAANPNLSTLHQAIFALRMNQHQLEAPVAWERHSKNLLSSSNVLNASEVLEWDAEKVTDFVETLPGCEEFAHRFEEEGIDGEAFLLINQSDLVKLLGIKLGPAVKIYNSILVIRDNINLEA
ncbi:lethal (3) malignant brain tumor [Brevipalpus obovatus]|uniref:lethal (3) malignant brain tumor n=1 Tax=Brevipalpus obovatus TaxID=246614 RepID=UPI003D9F3C87